MKRETKSIEQSRMGFLIPLRFTGSRARPSWLDTWKGRTDTSRIQLRLATVSSGCGAPRGPRLAPCPGQAVGVLWTDRHSVNVLHAAAPAPAGMAEMRSRGLRWIPDDDHGQGVDIAGRRRGCDGGDGCRARAGRGRRTGGRKHPRSPERPTVRCSPPTTSGTPTSRACRSTPTAPRGSPV